MNPLTAAVLALTPLYTCGAAVYVLRSRGQLRRPGHVRLACCASLVSGLLELLLLVFARSIPLTDRSVWPSLLQMVMWTTYIIIGVRFARPPDPILNRYAYTPTRQDKQLVLFAFAVPGAVIFAVFILLFVHSLGAFS